MNLNKTSIDCFLLFLGGLCLSSLPRILIPYSFKNCKKAAIVKHVNLKTKESSLMLTFSPSGHMKPVSGENVDHWE